jgi:hypothetical protein
VWQGAHMPGQGGCTHGGPHIWMEGRACIRGARVLEGGRALDLHGA